MENPTATLDKLELATKASVALIDLVCQSHVNGDELPKHFDCLGALIANCLEEAAAEAGSKLRYTMLPDQVSAIAN